MEREIVAKTESGFAWMPVVVGSMISGAASGLVGYLLGARNKPCACKTRPGGGKLPENGDGPGQGKGKS